jgi:hypothetical protein
MDGLQYHFPYAALTTINNQWSYFTCAARIIAKEEEALWDYKFMTERRGRKVRGLNFINRFESLPVSLLRILAILLSLSK